MQFRIRINQGDVLVDGARVIGCRAKFCLPPDASTRATPRQAPSLGLKLQSFTR